MEMTREHNGFHSSTGSIRGGRYTSASLGYHKASAPSLLPATPSYMPSPLKTDSSFSQYGRTGALPSAGGRTYYSPQVSRKFPHVTQDLSSSYRHIGDQRDGTSFAMKPERQTAGSMNSQPERRLPRQPQKVAGPRPRSRSLDRSSTQDVDLERKGQDFRRRRHSSVGPESEGTGLPPVQKSSLKSARGNNDKPMVPRSVRFASDTSSNTSIVIPQSTTSTATQGITGRASSRPLKAVAPLPEATTASRSSTDRLGTVSDRPNHRPGVSSERKDISPSSELSSTLPSSSFGNFSKPSETNVGTRYTGLSSESIFTPRTAVTPSMTSSDRTRGDGCVGLRNLGNTCFMNSIIQCLSHTAALRRIFLDNTPVPSRPGKGRMVTEFTKLLKNLWQPGVDSVAPMDFKGEVQRVAPRFIGYNQQDAQELLHAVLEGLHNELNRVTQKPSAYFDADTVRHLSCSEQADAALQAYLARENSVLTDLFVGQLRSTLTCSQCKRCSYTFDPFWDLSLPIPQKSPSTSSSRLLSRTSVRAPSYDSLGWNNSHIDMVSEVSLDDCFALFNREESLDGQEKAYCDHCGKRQPSRKKFTIQRLPKILVLHLKRFSASGYRRKLSTLVRFSQTIQLLSHVAETVGETMYRLYAVCNHSGGPYGGHYTAFCRTADNQWHSFNDRLIHPVSFASVCSSQAYVLFYEREQPSSKSKFVESQI